VQGSAGSQSAPDKKSSSAPRPAEAWGGCSIMPDLSEHTADCARRAWYVGWSLEGISYTVTVTFIRQRVDIGRSFPAGVAEHFQKGDDRPVAGQTQAP